MGANTLSITTASNNTAVGYSALLNNSTGSYNTASGYQALFSDTMGGTNTASGYDALYFNTTGSFNTATGRGALYKNTASNNTATGYQALNKNTSGGGNTAHGYQALLSNTSGSNTATGSQSLYHRHRHRQHRHWPSHASITTPPGVTIRRSGLTPYLATRSAVNNIAIGGSAGYYLTTGSNNIDIGNVGVAANPRRFVLAHPELRPTPTSPG